MKVKLTHLLLQQTGITNTLLQLLLFAHIFNLFFNISVFSLAYYNRLTANRVALLANLFICVLQKLQIKSQPVFVYGSMWVEVFQYFCNRFK